MRCSQVYEKIDAGADVNFVFGEAYCCREGYSPLMVAAHRCVAQGFLFACIPAELLRFVIPPQLSCFARASNRPLKPDKAYSS